MAGRWSDVHSALYSVVIGVVSSKDRARILETLQALRDQVNAPPFEVILADRRQDEISERIRDLFPEVRWLACEPSMSVPELRTRGLEEARGDIIVVTEDHCVPPRHWLAAIAAAFRRAPPGTLAVGGCVENGVNSRALDWATFLCEYAACMEPILEGRTTWLPGMNVAYRRVALAGVARSLLTQGFWETTLHPHLARREQGLYATNAIRLVHAKRFTFGLFARQRFLYSRHFAGSRFHRSAKLRRLLACAMCVGLPPLLLFRIARELTRRRRLLPQLARALPVLLVFVVIWAAGEMVGYCLGPGNSLARIE